MTTSRTIRHTITAVRTVEGGGFVVHRPFPTRMLMDFDPFLLLDEMGPVDYAPGQAKGAPDHPHRGFETVTYMLEGSFAHKDSAGHSGVLRPGDVQWMTAGAGVVHRWCDIHSAGGSSARRVRVGETARAVHPPGVDRPRGSPAGGVRLRPCRGCG